MCLIKPTPDQQQLTSRNLSVAEKLQLMTIKEPTKDQRIAFEKRLGDSWGKALLHLVPLYWLLYAVDRKTITPMLYSWLYSFILFFAGSLAISSLDTSNPEGMSEAQSRDFSIALYLLSPLGVYRGIRQSREYAKLRLAACPKPQDSNDGPQPSQ